MFTFPAVAGEAVQVRATFSCDSPPHDLTIECRFIEALPAAHRHIATLSEGAREKSFIVVRENPTIEVDVGGADTAKTTFGAMVWTGIRHIWTGYDHIAFLFGLVLLGGRARSLVGVVSAFTVAHSITLGLAVLHVVAPHPSIVEPAIALSIAICQRVCAASVSTARSPWNFVCADPSDATVSCCTALLDIASASRCAACDSSR